MRVLQVCKQFPFPLKDGYSVAVTSIASSLIANDCEVDLLAMNTTKHFVDLDSIPVKYNDYKRIYAFPIDNRISPLGAAINLFSSKSYFISRFIDKKFEKRLCEILQEREYDVVQLESVQLATYIPIIRAVSKAKIAMRAHNVEFEIWERFIKSIGFPPKKWYLQSQLSSFKSFEIDQLKNYDCLVAITGRDLEYFEKLGFGGASEVIPVGMDLEKYGNSQELDKTLLEELSFSFIGSMDWLPNQEGIEWFLKEVWTTVSEKFTEAKFHVAGRHIPERFLNFENQQTIFHGEVESAIEFIGQHPVMIVPLFSGGGIRVKILEAMAMGKVVITTALGAEGIPYTDKKDILIAETASDYVEVLKYCFENSATLAEIGSNAQQLIDQQFNYINLGKRLKTAYLKL